MASSPGSAKLIEPLLLDAAAAQRRGDDAAARRAWLEVLDAAPDQPVALNGLGMAALRAHEFAAAKTWFARAAAADPGAAPLWMNLATANRHLGDQEGERASLLSALGTDQRHLMANIRLAELHEREGDAANASQRWSGVLALCWAMPDRSPEIDQLIARAQAFIADYNGRLSAAVAEQVGDLRAAAPAPDRRRFDACLDALFGRRRIFHHEPEGLHYPFLPADEFFDREHFPWLAELEAQAPAIRAELEALLTPDLTGFNPYVAMAPGTPHSKWSTLDHSPNWSALHLWRHGERIDSACARCPRTTEIIETLPLCDLPGRTPTVFFSLLRPGTRLPAHTGVSNVRAVVHLPLIVPSGCAIRVGGETRAWREGEAFAFDDTIEHEAWNESDALRAVLILDTWNPHLTEAERDLLRRFYAVVEASGGASNLAAAVSD